jgi:starvation-inducible outer membrane lipoprotein
MTRKTRIPLRSLCAAIVLSQAVSLSGCAKVPRHYVRMAEPDTTLTMLVDHPEQYRGKVVMLGGAYIEEEEDEQYLWVRVTNRPLDQDYMPHRPPSLEGSEAGSYWLIVEKAKLPDQYRHWARMTVVGRVLDQYRLGTEPVLALLYVRGWGMSGEHDGIWEHVNPNYIPSAPGGRRIQ